MTSGVSAELLKQLSAASQTINQATDEFNEQIKALEEALASYNIGVSAWVSAYDETSDHTDDNGGIQAIVSTEYFLGYQKYGGKWSLMAATEEDYINRSSNQAERTEWLFRDAPRNVRIKTIPAVPTLLEALIKVAHRLAVDFAKQTADARALTESIRPKKGQ
jgi:hypothetical protein